MARKARRASPRLAYGKIGEQAPTGHKSAGRELGIPAVVGCGTLRRALSAATGSGSMVPTAQSRYFSPGHKREERAIPCPGQSARDAARQEPGPLEQHRAHGPVDLVSGQRLQLPDARPGS